jgi:glycosyltransferase involved in cell wall biosynthesis
MPFVRKTSNIFLLIWFFLNIIFYNFYYIFVIKRINPKIVICNSFQDSFFTAFPAKILRKKLIINIKNILDSRRKKIFRAKICDIFADKVIASSKKNAEEFLQFSKNKDKAVVIYDGIDAREFEKNYSKDDVYLSLLGKNDKSLRIVNIGNISELKGQLLLVQSLATSKLINLDLKVFLIGDVSFEKDFEYKNRINDFINQNGLSKKVFFLGYVENIKDYIKYSDVLVHCPVIAEGLGMVILEAFCYKKIVIATNIGGIPEMIDDSVNGFLCKTDKEDLAEKILYVYENISKLDFIRDNAYKKLINYFTLNDKIAKTEKIYEELLG